MKNRPLFNKSIHDLEQLHQTRGDEEKLIDQLLHELNFRSTPRAVNLKQKITTLTIKLPTPRKTGTRIPAPARAPIAKPASAPRVTKHPQLPRPPITNETENILRAWTALEVLSPQGFQREADLAGGDKRNIATLFDGPLPWERGERSRPRKRLYYELILGTINLGPTIEALLKVYADKRPDAPRTNRRSPLVCILLDKEGRPLEEDNSLAISSFAWGVPIALKGDLRQLANWPDAERGLIKALREKLIKRDQDGEVIPLDEVSINELFRYLVTLLGLDGPDISPPHFAIRRYEFFASKVPPEPSLLNSFYLQDLATARQLSSDNELPHALKFYIGAAKPKHRANLLEDRHGLRFLLQPALTSLGRWPGPGRFPLALLQQAAVNATSDGLEETRILSVNGPPGTGKTTLLRDVVAARVVERAIVMAEYENPKTAFSLTSQSMQRSGAKVTLSRLDDRLKGFEMVVASSNNKAVENVSAELPTLEAIASDADDLRYFSSVSDQILGRKSWGLIAAVLGNSSNRFSFAQAFWRDQEHGLSTYLNHASGVPQYVMEPQENGSPIKRLRSIVGAENPPDNQTEAIANWTYARATFIDEVNASRQFQNQLQAVHRSLNDLDELVQQILELEECIPELSHSIEDASKWLAASKSETEAALTLVQEWKLAISQHQKEKPGLFARLFRTQAARIWAKERTDFSAALNAQQQDALACQHSLDGASNRLASIQGEMAEVQASLENLNSQHEQLRKHLAHEAEAIGAPIPSAEFFGLSHEEIQCAHLWYDDAKNIQRDGVFESAMALHRAFIDCAAEPIRQNLAIFTESFGTRSLGTPQKDQMIPDLWSTFCLVVPVVSTTFASVNRMFSKLPPNTLGWLLVDEAGQAVPQAAVGAVMRSKRVVVVGDPLQIEPVVTLPNTLTEEICGFFGIEPLIYNAPEASVQTLADAASPYCARFPTGSGYRDAGSPLLVHRRCSSPMFEISNEIAYSNLMVQAKKESGEVPVLGMSCWIDVVGNSGPDKWCEDEATALIDLLKKLKSVGGTPDVYVVTPFVVVQDNLRKRLNQTGLLEGWVENPYLWLREHVGTVHTVQGREAGMVFFVLGAQASSQNGARNWAGSRPNLPNVAVTRAKSALYVIGNRSLWASAGFFSVLDRFLPAGSLER